MTDSELLEVFSLFGFGEKSAVKGETLKAVLGLDSTRQVRLMIHRLRLRGLLVCSSDSGYFRPATEEELSRFVRRMDAQARTIREAVKGAKRRLKMEAPLRGE